MIMIKKVPLTITTYKLQHDCLVYEAKNLIDSTHANIFLFQSFYNGHYR